MKIGIFDSGIGGLTVLKRLLKEKPNNEYLYFGDTLHLPYGNKSIKELKQYASHIIDFFIEQGVDQIIIACGTVSSNIYPYLQQKYNIPILDIISPVVEDLKGKVKQVGLLATEMTIQSNLFQKKLEDVGISVIPIACPLFVPIIESKKYDQIKPIIHTYLKVKQKENIDLFILGCTHYPFIQKEIEEVTQIPTYDMSIPIVQKITEGTYQTVTLYFSELTQTRITQIHSILEHSYSIIKKVV